MAGGSTAESTTKESPTTDHVGAAQGAAVGRRILRVESNLLGLPFFALQKRGRNTRKYLEVNGVKWMPDGARRDFRYKVARNSDRKYPGLLSRKIHDALLDIMQQPKHGFLRSGDLQNPVTYTMRGLYDRMEVAWHGKVSIERAKSAILDTVGATIFTNDALLGRFDDRRTALPDIDTGYHLYDRAVFCGDAPAEGLKVDKNAVYFSDWYFANLNTFMSAPLDYQRWLSITHQSHLASRMYEFFLCKFNRSIPFLQINYPYFVSFLPAVAY